MPNGQRLVAASSAGALVDRAAAPLAEAAADAVVAVDVAAKAALPIPPADSDIIDA